MLHDTLNERDYSEYISEYNIGFIIIIYVRLSFGTVNML